MTEIHVICYCAQTGLVFALEGGGGSPLENVLIKGFSCLLQSEPRWIQQVSP